MRNYVLLLTCLILLVLATPSPADETPSWPKIYWEGPGSGKYISLTFDDAPMEGLPELLDILDELDVKATFFVEGQFMAQRPGMIGEIYERGHELGNHSYTHPDLTTLTDDAVYDELVSTSNLIFEETGIETHLFRPPGGQRNSGVDSIAYDLEMTTVMWTVNTGDYMASEAQIRSKILSRIESGGIILMHDGVPATRNVLPEVVSTLRARGYTFVTVGEMLELTYGENSWVSD